ncbi:MAG: GNAT family N-acetyltransferase [Lactobacillus sp.]|jgi:RimJ/RimL family protein N-acetyltransferase|nr:GNAT family N-acetyltransferase [Lactobacillus sp.]
MTRTYFLKTKRLGFSNWQLADLPLAQQLWGDPAVTKYISQSGIFSPATIVTRLHTEITTEKQQGVQYWPLFNLQTTQFVGCCGLRPSDSGFELGYHLRPEFWHQGYGTEAAQAVITYAFSQLKLPKLVAGHHPDNKASRAVLLRLGFKYMGTEYYPPTGLDHPTYVLINPNKAKEV